MEWLFGTDNGSACYLCIRIMILLTIRTGGKHSPRCKPPHFHVILRDGKEALIEISRLEILQGNVPRRELSEVLQWAASNRNMLLNKFEELQK